MRKIPLTALVAASSFSAFAPAHAATVSSPFEIALSPEGLSSLLGQPFATNALSGNLQIPLPDQSIATPFPVQLSGISLALAYEFAAPLPQAASAAGSAQWNVRSESISAQLTIQNINASQVVQLSENGTTLSVTLQASCSNVVMSLPAGQASIAASIGLSIQNGELQTQLSDFQASWASGAWSVTSMNCSGPQGFPELVIEQATAALSSIGPFLPEISQEVGALLMQGTSQVPLNWNVQLSAEPPASALLSATAVTLTPSGGATLDGRAVFDFPSVTQSCGSAGALTPEVSAPASPDTLSVPSGLVTVLAQCAYFAGILQDEWNSSGFPAFESLMGNFFYKLFLWPDLLSFSDSASFEFTAAPSSQPWVQISGEDSSGITAEIQTPLSVQMQVIQDAAAVPYVTFTSGTGGISSLAHLSLSSGQLSVSLGLSSLGLQSTFAPSYVAAHHPDTYIATSVIGGYLKDYLNSTPISFALPTLGVPGQVQFVAQTLNLNGQRLELGVSVDGPSP